MRLGKPTPLEAEYLAKLGLAGLCNVDLPDADLARHLDILRRQHGVRRHGVEHHDEATLRARALARAAHDSYGRKKLAEQAPHPYVQQMNRRLNIAIVCIIVAILGMLFFAVKGHAQTAKGNAGPASRANMWFWNGSAYVPVESGSPFPVSCVSGCVAGGSFTDNSPFGVNSSAISPMGCYYTSGAAPAISSGNAGRCRIDVNSLVMMDCATGCSGTSGSSTTGTLGALNATVAIALDTYTASGFAVTAGSLTGTLTPEVSYDGGTTWKTTYFVDLSQGSGNMITGALNPNSGLGYMVLLPPGTTNARVKVTAYTSGSVTGVIRAMAGPSLATSLSVDWTTGALGFRWFDSDNGGARMKLYDAAGNNRAANVNASNQLLTSAFQGTNPWVVSVPTWAGGTLGAMANYGTNPGAVLVPGVNAFVTNIPAVTQSSGPWTFDHTKTAGQTLGAIANYGTSPGAVLVEGTNAFVTNNVAVTLSAETTKVIGTVNQGTSPWTVAGGLTENNATPPATQLAMMPCRSDTNTRAVTVTFQVLLSCDANDLLRISLKDTPSNTNNLNVNLAAAGATVGVTQSTSPWVGNMTQWATTALGTPTNFGTTPGAVIAGSVNAAQFIGTTAQANDGTAGFAGVGGHFADNGVAAATNRIPTLDCIYQTSYLNGTAATQGRNGAQSCGTDGLLWTASLPSIRPASYHWSASFAGSSTTFAAHIAGNATNTLLLTGIRASCTATTAGIPGTWTITKTSAASTGGTAATMTAIPDDSNYAAASSVAQSFTGTGPTAGTPVGQIDAYKLDCNATGTAGPNDIYISPAWMKTKPIVLRGTAQTVEVGFGAAVTGGNYTVTFEGIETATILP